MVVSLFRRAEHVHNKDVHNKNVHSKNVHSKNVHSKNVHSKNVHHAGTHGEEDDDQAAAKTIEVSARVIAEAARGSAFHDDRAPRDGQERITNDLLDQALAERGTLVQLCLYALDRARSSGVAERIEEGLASIGVTALRPEGDRFDPAHHEAGGTVKTEDAELDGTVAETEVVGFADRGRLLRAPIVTVYTTKTTA